MSNLDVLGDDCYIFFECVKPDIVTFQEHSILMWYLQKPRMFEFILLLKSAADVKIRKRISVLLYI